jgi:5'-3' exonuclease
MSRYHRILVDIAGIYFRAFSVPRHLAADVNGKRMVTGGIFTAIKMLQRIERDYLAEGGRIYFLFDNALSGEDRRKDIDPDYKINRKKRDPQFYRGLDYLQLVLMHYQTGYRIVRRPTSEADDLVAPILESFGDKQYSILLVSNDMDWSRAISDTVHWLVRKDNQDVIYTKGKFYEEYGFYPGLSEVCLYKAIRGDIADNIPPGVKNIPETVVLDIIHQVKNVSNMFLNLAGLNIPVQWKDAIRQNRGRIQLNLMLVDYQPVSMADCRECTLITEYNKEMLSKFYRMLNFKPEGIDERLRKPDIPAKEEDFFKDFDVYPRAD